MKLFNLDSPLMRFMTKVADLILVNLLFILTSLPVFTLGASLTAMYYVTLKMVRDEESGIVRSFLHSFRQNFRQATLLWLVQLVLMAILVLDMWILARINSPVGAAMNTVILILLVIVLLISLYVYSSLARFENTIMNTLKNACLMAAANLPRTVLMGVFCAGSVFITLYNEYTLVYGAAVWLFLGFALIAFGNSGILAKIFEKYLPQAQ